MKTSTTKVGELYLAGKFFVGEAQSEMEKGMLNHLVARRFAESKVTFAGEVQKRKIVEMFKSKYGLNVSLKWNKYCGCSMCPCSPGFEVIAHLPGKPYFKMRDDDRLPVWVEDNGRVKINRQPSYYFQQVQELAKQS